MRAIQGLGCDPGRLLRGGQQGALTIYQQKALTAFVALQLPERVDKFIVPFFLQRAVVIEA